MSFVGVLLLWSAMHHPQCTDLARAQTPTGFTHQWGAQQGSMFHDEGRGVGVRRDGSVIWTGTAWGFGPINDDQTIPMTLVKKYTPAGTPCWSVSFLVGPGENSVASRGLALANPFVEPTIPPETTAIGYVGGRFKGEVHFEALAYVALKDSGYVAKIVETSSACAAGSATVEWVTYFEPRAGGTRSAVNAVAAARLRRKCTTEDGDDEGLSTAVFRHVVAGGFFNGETAFGAVGTLSSTADDAFVALLTTAGEVSRVFTIGGPGNQRITALAIDERTQDIIVAGWYDHPETNFNPNPSGEPVTSTNYQDGRDLFVARYNVRLDGVELLWLYTFGTTATPGEDFYDDEATCVALSVDDTPHVPPHTHNDPPGSCRDGVAPATLAIVGGIRSDTPRTTPGAGRNDLLFLAVSQPSSGIHATHKWLYSPAGDHDERVTAVAVDGIGRPVFTGHVGCYVASGAPPCTGQTLVDFDPGPGTLTLPSDSQNAFVVRYHPITGGLDWAYAIGGNLNEGGTAIAFDPVHTARFALTGFFGREDAMPGLYSIDLDPDPAAFFEVTSDGLSDSFLTVLDPSTPADVGVQISLVLSNSCTMTRESSGQRSLEFVDMLDGLRIALQNNGVIPWPGQLNPGNGEPRQRTVQINAVFYTTNELDGRRAVQVMPWTVFDGQTAALFARRLAALPPLDTGDAGWSQHMSHGMVEAVAGLARSRVPDLTAVYSSMLVIGDAPGGPDVPAARDAAFGSDRFDRICALGGYGALGPGGSPPPDTRNYQLLDIIAPRPPGNDPDDIDRYSTGISTAWHTILRTPEPCDAKWQYFFFLQRLLQRLAWCPSDFNRDECTDENGNPATDDFMLWYQARQHLEPYTDWNMDGHFDINIDPDKLNTGFEGLPPRPNRRVCNACPNQ